MYKLIKNKKGDRWMKDGKFVSADSVPEVDKRIVLNQDIYTGEAATHKRIIGGVMIPLSDSSYYKETVGSITGYLNKERNIDVQQETPVGSSA